MIDIIARQSRYGGTAGDGGMWRAYGTELWRGDTDPPNGTGARGRWRGREVVGFNLFDPQHPESFGNAPQLEIRRGAYVGARVRF